MKKYKLIKEYPGSPKLGTIISQLGTSQFYEDKHNSAIMKKCFDYKIFSKYPEFWEEIVEKDYEILSLVGINNPIIIVDVFETVKSHYKTKENFVNEYLKGDWKIHSVKRLSDGEIFTVGDKNSQGKIDAFHIFDNDELRVHLTEFNDQEYLHICELKTIKKPLFTTEDGVDIYEGDKYFYPTHLYTVSSETLPIKSKVTNTSWDNLMRYSQNNNPKFSTKEAAEEYILMNKPCLSIEEVMSVAYNPVESRTSSSRKLKEIVKSKL